MWETRGNKTKMRLKRNKGGLDPAPFPSWGPQPTHRSREGGWGSPTGPDSGPFTAMGGGVCLGKQLSGGGVATLSPRRSQYAEEGNPSQTLLPHKPQNSPVDLTGLRGVLCPCGPRGPGWTPAPSGGGQTGRSWHPHPRCHNGAPQQEAGWFPSIWAWSLRAVGRGAQTPR